MFNVNIFVNFYITPSIIRNEEIIESIKQNISDSNISRIYIIRSKNDNHNIESTKIIDIIKEARPTYNDIINIANSVTQLEDVNAIINSDCWFNSNFIHVINNIKPTECYTMNRMEIKDINNLNTAWRMVGTTNSQDGWVFKGKIQNIDGNFYMGIPGCDNRICYQIFKAGYSLINPIKSDVYLYHYHKDNYRSYTNKDKIPRPYALVSESMVNVPSKLDIMDVQYVDANYIQKIYYNSHTQEFVDSVCKIKQNYPHIKLYQRSMINKYQIITTTKTINGIDAIEIINKLKYPVNNTTTIIPDVRNIKETLVSVVIPIYKEQPTENELYSYNKCLDILGSYPISIICPNNLDLTTYNTSNPNITINKIDPKFFTSVRSYNALMLSNYFYNMYSKSRYILIYQLDALVFSDELNYWCNSGYDYIGAPWSNNTNNNVIFTGVGNGGFCLRNVDKAINVLNKISIMRTDNNILQATLNTINNDYHKKLVIELVNNDPNIQEKWINLSNEDIFWGYAAKYIISEFNISSGLDAIKFSMETNVERLYELNNKQLPFGCHAWEIRSPEFWKKILNHNR